MSDQITLEQLEALAESIFAEEGQRRERLLRLVRAYTRILSVREPKMFKPTATVWADEDGHWDNSYPPDQKYKERTGPRVIRLRALDFDSRATSGGFYHTTKYFTTTPGIYIDASGAVWSSDIHGTGNYGQFAAHPGACDVDCEIDYCEMDDDDIPIEVLVDAEELLRAKAFPMATAAASV